MSGRGRIPRKSDEQPYNSGGKPRREREFQRAYTNNQQRIPWADSEPYYPMTDEQAANRRKHNKSRSDKWQKTQPPKPPKKETPPPVVAAAVSEDPPADAPLYDSTPFTSGVPYNQEYCQNFDFASFPVLCNETYQTLQGINPRLNRDVPFPAFLHNMNCLLQTTIIDTVYEDGQRPVEGQDGKAQDILPQEYVIPGPIYEYLSNVSTVMTPGNQEVKVNLPDIMIPRTAYIDDDDNEIPAGTFGPADAESHNVYESQLCPYTTMEFVVQSALDDRPEDWAPIPNELIPDGGVPTNDFLGFLPIPHLHAEGRESLRMGVFEDGEGIAGRVRYNAALFARCNAELTKMEEKFKMVKMGLEKGVRKYVKFKTDPGNLIFSESVDPNAALNTRMVRLFSNYAYGTNAAGSAGINTFHRRRTEAAPGCCFRFDGAYAQNWIDTRNTLFDMQGDFAPVRGVLLPQLHDALNRTSLVDGERTAAVNSWVRRNFLKKQ